MPKLKLMWGLIEFLQLFSYIDIDRFVDNFKCGKKNRLFHHFVYKSMLNRHKIYVPWTNISFLYIKSKVFCNFSKTVVIKALYSTCIYYQTKTLYWTACNLTRNYEKAQTTIFIDL